MLDTNRDLLSFRQASEAAHVCMSVSYDEVLEDLGSRAHIQYFLRNIIEYVIAHWRCNRIVQQLTCSSTAQQYTQEILARYSSSALLSSVRACCLPLIICT